MDLENRMNTRLKIYTDGACSFNGRGGRKFNKGAWSVVFPHQEHLNVTGVSFDTTNNRMELRAAIEALKRVNQDVATIYSDSAYVIDTINLGYKKRKNKDLWEELEKESQNKDIEWRWVKSHSGVRWNEVADKLATEALEKIK